MRKRPWGLCLMGWPVRVDFVSEPWFKHQLRVVFNKSPAFSEPNFFIHPSGTDPQSKPPKLHDWPLSAPLLYLVPLVHSVWRFSVPQDTLGAPASGYLH